jgi:hypothetical protein
MTAACRAEAINLGIANYLDIAAETLAAPETSTEVKLTPTQEAAASWVHSATLVFSAANH